MKDSCPLERPDEEAELSTAMIGGLSMERVYQVPQKLESYEITDNILGRGSSGIVCEAKDKQTHGVVAVKIADKKHGNSFDLNDFRKEAEILRTLKHQNVLRFLGLFEDNSKIYLFTELVGGGELFNRMIERNGFEESEARTIIKKILAAIDYLHRNNIVHRDIKAENIIFISEDDDYDLRLIDFGFAAKAEGYSLTGELGTPDYMAPEIWGGDLCYGAPVDMWALGVLSYLILASYPPFLHHTPLGVKTKIIRGVYEFHPEYWDVISPEAKDFVSRLLTVDMGARMTAEQALQHPWLATGRRQSNPATPSPSLVPSFSRVTTLVQDERDERERKHKELTELTGITEIMKTKDSLDIMDSAAGGRRRSVRRRPKTIYSAPMAVNRMKRLYTLRKSKNCECLGKEEDLEEEGEEGLVVSVKNSAKPKWYSSSLSCDTIISVCDDSTGYDPSGYSSDSTGHRSFISLADDDLRCNTRESRDSRESRDGREVRVVRESSESGLLIERRDKRNRGERRDRALRVETLYDVAEGGGLERGMKSDRFKGDQFKPLVSCVSTTSVYTDTENASNFSESLLDTLGDSSSPMTRARSLTEVSCISDDDGDEVVEGDEEGNFRVSQILLELTKVDEND